MDKLFSGFMEAVRLATPAIAQLPAFKALAEAAIGAFQGDRRQDELKAAYQRARAEADAAEQDFKDAAAGR